MSRNGKFSRRLLVAAAVAFSGALAVPSVALANHEGSERYQTHLSPLNGSGSSGETYVSLDGDQVTVRLRTTGASPNLPHAQHFHIGGNNQCPTLANSDMNNDGLISSVEGQPSYGPVEVSLTTSGDVSAASGLAVDRFPVANAAGVVNYQRTFTLPSGVSADDVKNAVVVQHGISELFENPNMYDGDPRSSLDMSLPLEATIPAACGALVADERQQEKHERQEEREERRREREERQAERQREREERRNDRDDAQHGISNTGPGSDNRISVNNSTSISVDNDVEVSVDNDNSQQAESGDAEVNDNTRGGSAVSGDAMNHSETEVSLGVSL